MVRFFFQLKSIFVLRGSRPDESFHCLGKINYLTLNHKLARECLKGP